MSARVEADPQAAAAAANQAAAATYATAQPIAQISTDPEDRAGGHALPSDHPAWMRDTLSISLRARALLQKVRPIAVRVFAYWEHRVRSVTVAGGRISVDASGSYRLN